ncbi:XRE family transcriptional regulator [Sphaerisporangium album]|uniref:XRE family transcriptional regulator n=1 Tax=Sphaerisporangium album TaxID=509200 RepID=A0A367FRZ3_9ACTN|nr:helix-turn-helix transcriptional regulator [Sphaerisporangium album]RCG32679.1 XRE family transcriptional regulator [Sphaerisporangium album]
MSTVHPPSFGEYVRHLRSSTTAPGFSPGPPAARKPLSREKLAVATGISQSYLTKLEQERNIRPSPEVVDQLATALEVNGVVRKHMHDLVAYAQAKPSHSPPSPPPPRPEVTPEERKHIDALYPNLAGWVDDAWWVLHGNGEYNRLYRRLDEVGNVLIWFFAIPESRKIMIEWEVEARLTVAWLRTHMVQRAEDPSFLNLLEELSEYPDFVTMWRRQEILMGRHTPYMRVRDLDTGRELTLLANVYRHPDPTCGIQLYIGSRHEDTD